MLEQPHKDALFLCSWSVLETRVARLACLWRSCQGRFTCCPHLMFLSPCFLRTCTQHSLWHLWLLGCWSGHREFVEVQTADDRKKQQQTNLIAKSRRHFVRAALDFAKEPFENIVGANGLPVFLRISIKGQTRFLHNYQDTTNPASNQPYSQGRLYYRICFCAL